MNKRLNTMSRLPGISSALLVLTVLFPSVAFAYVDPGSGSVIVTTILGFIAAVGYTFRKYFYKMKRFVRGKKSDDDRGADRDET